jgi:hypothetical protein
LIWNLRLSTPTHWLSIAAQIHDYLNTTPNGLKLLERGIYSGFSCVRYLCITWTSWNCSCDEIIHGLFFDVIYRWRFEQKIKNLLLKICVYKRRSGLRIEERKRDKKQFVLNIQTKAWGNISLFLKRLIHPSLFYQINERST